MSDKQQYIPDIAASVDTSDHRIAMVYRGQWIVWREGYTPTAGTLLNWRRRVDETIEATRKPAQEKER